jgi:hypothetical protein
VGRQAGQRAGAVRIAGAARDLRDRWAELELQRRVGYSCRRELSDRCLDLGRGGHVIDLRRDDSVRVHAVTHVYRMPRRRLRATASTILGSIVDHRHDGLVRVSVARVRDQGFDVEEAESEHQQERQQMAGESRARANHRVVVEASRRVQRTPAAIDLSDGTL